MSLPPLPPELLAAVQAEPDDFTARLILADYLDEHDDPRGEWVRLAVARAGWRPNPLDRERDRRRAGTLFEDHLREPLEPVTNPARYRFSRAGWWEVSLSAADALALGDAPPAALDLLGTLRLTGTPDAILAALTPALGTRLHALDLRGNGLTLRDVDELAKHLDALGGGWRVPRLDLRANALTPGDMPHLAGLPALARAREVRLDPDLWSFGTQPSGVVLNAIGMRLVPVPAGMFVMGSPPSAGSDETDETAHPVRLTRGLLVGEVAVTQRQYERVTGENPSRFREAADAARRPVEMLTWEAAVRFCALLSALPEEVAAGRRYRLPTEAEWEFACRAGSVTRYNVADALTRHLANCAGWVGSTSVVASYPANRFGLCDCHGNVREWCADHYKADYYASSPVDDPPGPAELETRVMRGGSWDITSADYARSAYRVYTSPTSQLPGVGFRVVCEREPPVTGPRRGAGRTRPGGGP